MCTFLGIGAILVFDGHKFMFICTQGVGQCVCVQEGEESSHILLLIHCSLVFVSAFGLRHYSCQQKDKRHLDGLVFVFQGFKMVSLAFWTHY